MSKVESLQQQLAAAKREESEAADRARLQAEAQSANDRAVVAYELDVASAKKQVADAEDWLKQVQQHQLETEQTLASLKAAQP